MRLSAILIASSALCFFVATLLINVLVTEHLLNTRQAGPQIVTVDAAEALTWFAASRPFHISEEEWTAELVELNARIGPAVAEMSRRHGVVVLNTAAVLTGAPNYTPQLTEILAGGRVAQ